MNIINLYKESFSGLRPQVWYLALMMLVNRMGSLVLPFLTLYTTQELGWSKVDSGLSSAAFGVGSMVGAFAGGWLVDRIGYWRVIIIGQLGAAYGFFCLQFLTSFWPLCIGLFLSAAVADILRPGVMTGVNAVTNTETRTRGISLLRMSFNLGFTMGPALAGFIIAATSYKAIFILDGCTCLAAGIFGYFYINRDNISQVRKSEKAEGIVRDKGKSPFSDGPFLWFMFWSILMLIGFFQILFTVPLFMKEELGYTEKLVGLYFGINGIIVFISEMPIVYTVERRYKLMNAMIAGGVLIAISYLCLMLPFAGWVVIGLYLLFISYGEIVNFPFITSLTLRRTDKNNVGQYMGIMSMLFSLAIIVSPVVGTNLVDHFGYNVTWMVSAGLSLVACVGWYALDQEFRKKEEQPLDITG